MEIQDSFWAWLGALFVGSFGLAALLTRVRTPRRPNLDTEQVIRLYGATGTSRTRIAALDEEGIHLYAPLQLGTPVLMHVGEEYRAEVAVSGGVIHFRTTVASRNAQSQQITLHWPKQWSMQNRREQPRVLLQHFQATLLNDEPAVIMDYSANGAKLIAIADLKTGDFVRFEHPQYDEPVIGCVLEVLPSSLGTRSANQVRVQFSAN